jgi:ligand-binding sensor domain-containing protein
VRASQYKLSRVYATLNGYRNDHFASYVYVSEDYGQNWTAIGKNLPAEPVNVIIEDSKEENILYLGTDNGLYSSFNRGETFMSMGLQMPNVPVHDLVIQTRENELVIGTHGRSIYITKLDEVQKKYAAKK